MDEKIPCPVDPYCQNWDSFNVYCPEGGCRESDYKTITAADIPFYTNKRIMESEVRIAQTKERERRKKLNLIKNTWAPDKVSCNG